jgi:disulfide bond formation protein DsbB
MFIRKYGLYFAWLVASLGAMGSLYFSEIKNYEPCHLCWYQRISLFPLFIILGIAAHRGFLGISRYVLPQVIAGFLLALYQVAIQEIPGWNPFEICGAGPSCSDKISIGLGPITLPMLSSLGFLVIMLLLIAVWIADLRHGRSSEEYSIAETR